MRHPIAVYLYNLNHANRGRFTERLFIVAELDLPSAPLGMAHLETFPVPCYPRGKKGAGGGAFWAGSAAASTSD